MSEEPEEGEVGGLVPRRWASDESALEIYADAARAAASLYTIALELGLGSFDEPERSHLLVRCRMSPQHAKVTALMLMRAVLGYEQVTQRPVQVPDGIYEQMGVADLQRHLESFREEQS
ncbi:MAG: hypothetical protein M3Q65_12010 [Chloroflexota bacterium]|nr:hypothetical protein [Chloroflexota bacterium]